MWKKLIASGVLDHYSAKEKGRPKLKAIAANSCSENGRTAQVGCADPNVRRNFFGRTLIGLVSNLNENSPTAGS